MNPQPNNDFRLKKCPCKNLNNNKKASNFSSSGGLIPNRLIHFLRKLARENRRYEELWGTEVKVVSTSKYYSQTSLLPVTQPVSKNKKWPGKVETDFHFLSLDDIVLKDFSRPLHIRLWKYLQSWASYVFSGTSFAFIRHAWRFALYFAYPPIMLLLALMMSMLFAAFIATSLLPLAPLLAIVGFAICFMTLVKYGGDRYHVLHLMDLWSFSSDFINRSRTDIDEKLDQFAKSMASQINTNTYDEVLFIGHSTGGALMLDAVGRMLEDNPNSLNNAKSSSILTLGSTALKNWPSSKSQVVSRTFEKVICKP